MGDPVTINLRHVARGLGIPLGQVQAVLDLLDEGNTVPFITRYRKDQTGGLDEEQIRQIQARLDKLRLLAERKQTILRSIESQGKLTERLSKQIRNASTAKRLEDLYLPYKPKKQTLATIARLRGLEPLANEILSAEEVCADLDSRAADFVNPDRQVPTAAEALLGAGHIIAEQFSERADLRHRLREILHRSGKLVSVQAGPPPSEPAGERAVNQAGQGPQSSAPEQPQATASEAETGDDVKTAFGASGGSQEAPPEPTQTPPQGEASSETPGEAAPAADGKPPGEAAGQPQTEVEQPAEVVAQPRQPAEVQAEPEQLAPAKAPPEGSGEAETAPEPPAEVGAQAAPLAKPRSTQVLPQPAEASVRSATKTPPPLRADRRASKKEQKKKKAEEKRQKAFRDYFDYTEEIRKIPPHRVLAINRGERAKLLRVKTEVDLEAMHRALDELCVPQDHPHAEFLRGCARDALSRLILPSLEREARRELTERAEAHAVGVFARNLRNLLLQPPVRGRRVLAVDPGYRSGCKLAALDQFGNLLAHDVIYLVGRPERREEAKRIVAQLVDRYLLTVITIGNGTACREAEDFFARLIAEELQDKDLAYVIVNEAGASVYSTSRNGREEFPHYDASLRGAISIGRRLQDPLSELVKIDPASIGVGLYQHDVKAKHLRASLDEVVESCVNYVGVDVNTASPALLRYVSGLNQLTARRVFEHRQEHGPFRNREQLREVAGFGEATFVQAAGFLKITGGDNPLDATWIHPESYEVAGRVMAKLGCTPHDLNCREAAERLKGRISQVDVAGLAKELLIGELLLKDILAQLARPGRDPREDLPPPVFKQGVLKLEDLNPGMELTGTVLNVVDFGAFVDIGMHDSGLVHVSQLADKYVRDPHDVIAVGDVVKVWVLDVDKPRRRVSLTMISPGSRRSPGRRDHKPSRQAPDRPKRPPAAETPRPQGRPRPKGAPRGTARGPSRPRHKPKPRAKPVTPITEEMKAGTEPLRSFSDLAQFFQTQEAGTTKGGKKSKPRPAKQKAQAPEDEAQTRKAQPQSTEDDTPTGEAQPQGPKPDENQPPDQAPSDQPPPQASGREPESPQPAAQNLPQEPQAPTAKDEPSQDGPDPTNDPPESSPP